MDSADFITMVVALSPKYYRRATGQKGFAYSELRRDFQNHLTHPAFATVGISKDNLDAKLKEGFEELVAIKTLKESTPGIYFWAHTLISPDQFFLDYLNPKKEDAVEVERLAMKLF